jgi:hypothetical protein
MEYWSVGVIVTQEGKEQMKDKTGAWDYVLLNCSTEFRLLVFCIVFSSTPVFGISA